MPDSASPRPVKFALSLASSAFPSSDPRWRTQVDNLLADLKRGGAVVSREVTAVPGTKGGIDTIILALGTSGAITGAVTAFRLWLSKPGNKSITVTSEDEDGKKTTKTITGENVSEATFLELCKRVTK